MAWRRDPAGSGTKRRASWQSSWTGPLLSVGVPPPFAAGEPGSRLASDALERLDVGAVGWTARRADLDVDRRRELVVLEPRHHAFDHARGALDVGVEQDERDGLLVGREEIGLPQLAADHAGDFTHRGGAVA